ncbi:hypothetical protein [Candidatus Babela massiliensis]|uniref:Uncharacterized protein n=1 Tax=Candidatus Babela massiliensis TaxID=673862 RepID=V6DI24_9BACT|nr:hypothetical protein [Candidatus Babela massiliensis]CDK30583.1 hypothetical protein BABL1_gene_433 [Candidatus Babela massiliensis]
MNQNKKLLNIVLFLSIIFTNILNIQAKEIASTEELANKIAKTMANLIILDDKDQESYIKLDKKWQSLINSKIMKNLNELYKKAAKIEKINAKETEVLEIDIINFLAILGKEIKAITIDNKYHFNKEEIEKINRYYDTQFCLSCFLNDLGFEISCYTN